MKCHQFQEVLPNLVDDGGNAEEEEHLRTCPDCADLVQDLRSIAGQAKLLLPMHEPSPKVWLGIQQGLHQQAMIAERGSAPSGSPLTFPAQTKSWTPLGWAMAAVALIVFSVVLTKYQRQSGDPPLAKTIVTQPWEPEDQQLMTRVSQHATPDVQRAYEDNLREVNTYIWDARQAVAHDPQDEVAQQQLLDAYQQKQVLYEMATARTLP